MIEKALENLRPNSKWIVRGFDYEGIEWLDDEQTLPTKKEINDWIKDNESIIKKKAQLKELDAVLPRWAEDLIDSSQTKVYGITKEVKEAKKRLRDSLK